MTLRRSVSRKFVLVEHAPHSTLKSCLKVAFALLRTSFQLLSEYHLHYRDEQEAPSLLR